MFRTLKGKITFIYLCLVVTIAIVGIVSVVNLYSLSKSIDGLMVDNYKSINAVNNMLEILEKQNIAVSSFVRTGKKESVDSFYENTRVFNKWFNIESNNITETGERDYVDKIEGLYTEYIKLFSNVQLIRDKNGLNSANDYYDTNIVPVFLQLRSELKSISLLNEKAMLKSKDRVTNNSRDSVYIISILLIIAVIGGYAFSRIYTNKFFKPVYLLIDAMKLVKEGDMDKQAPVLTNDEIGAAAAEFNNMTKRLKQFEESTLGKLLEEKNKSLAIVKSISDPLIVLDTNYKIILLNSACESFFNIKEEKVINKHFLEAIRNGELFDYISSVYQSEADENRQKIIHLQSEDTDFYFNVIVTVVKDKEAKVNGVVVIFQNVTQLKQIEKMKTGFISTISHEFKTPLTSIMFGTSLILDNAIGTLNTKQKEILDAIREDSEKLLSLVNNLLQLSKVEYDKSIFNMAPCSITDIIQNSLREFTEQAEKRGIKLLYTPNPNLPEIKGDFEKLTWVINNLVSNALKYTDSGDEISIDTYIKEDFLYISIRDTGIGIPDEYKEKIFEKFVQVKGQDQEVRGTGLGLAIAKEIVEYHGGRIWCESRINEGSTFTFTLPVITY